MENRHQKSAIVHYGPQYSPTSVEEAEQKIEFLTTKMQEIDDQLTLTKVVAFPSQQAYGAWHRSAVHARSKMRNELKFLRQWLNAKMAQEKSRTKTLSKSISHEALIEELEKYTATLVAEISRDYTPMYSPDSPPQDKESAQARMSILAGFKVRIQAGFSEVTARYAQIKPSHQKAFVALKAPLHQILAKVEIEVTTVRGVLRAESQKIDVLLKGLAQTIARATTEGFALNPEEEQIFTLVKNRYQL